MIKALMMLAKITTLGLSKTKIFCNKGYDVRISVHDITSNIFLRESNSIADVVMLPWFGNSSISVRKVIITSIL